MMCVCFFVRGGMGGMYVKCSCETLIFNTCIHNYIYVYIYICILFLYMGT